MVPRMLFLPRKVLSVISRMKSLKMCASLTSGPLEFVGRWSWVVLGQSWARFRPRLVWAKVQTLSQTPLNKQE